MHNKPDNKGDKARKIKKIIDDTKQNMEVAEEMIASTSNSKIKDDLQTDNERRSDAITSMKREMREEANHGKE